MPVPVLTISQMRDWEHAAWSKGQTETEVIRRVGQCVAAKAIALTQPGDLILVLAGKGNNGADARAAGQFLGTAACSECISQHQGALTSNASPQDRISEPPHVGSYKDQRRVELLDIRDPSANLAQLEDSLLRRPELIVDGLFGIGLSRPLAPEWCQFIERLNQAHAPVLAVDVPSGLDADSGQSQGAVVQASVTLTVGAPKSGLLRPAASPWVGRLEVAAEVGLGPCPHSGETLWTIDRDFAGFPPRRMAATHKGDYGYLGILAGSLGYHGAAVLAARGAQRAQPGLITLHTLEAVYHSVAPQLQAVMVTPWAPAVKWTGRNTALLIGPGLAAPDVPDQMKMLTRHLWRDALFPVVVDASALDWLPLDPVPKNVIRVITPHPGEAARLLRCSAEQVQANRPEALRNISRRFGHTLVVLKGHQTLIGRSSGEIFVNSSGNPHLAQGGSGDVLSGYLAGFLSQPALQTDPLQTVRYAVWQHGRAADCLQAAGSNWTIEELEAQLGLVDCGTRKTDHGITGLQD